MDELVAGTNDRLLDADMLRTKYSVQLVLLVHILCIEGTNGGTNERK